MTALRISSEAGDYISIDRIDPSEADIRIAVEVRSRGFTGRIDTWILRQAWIDFCDQLSAAEAWSKPGGQLRLNPQVETRARAVVQERKQQRAAAARGRGRGRA